MTPDKNCPALPTNSQTSHQWHTYHGFTHLVGNGLTFRVNIPGQRRTCWIELQLLTTNGWWQLEVLSSEGPILDVGNLKQLQGYAEFLIEIGATVS